jgi:hypothetical protein
MCTNAGVIRTTLNMAFMEMTRRNCLTEYTQTRTDKIKDALGKLVDSNNSSDLKEAAERAINKLKGNQVEPTSAETKDKSRNKFFVENAAE